MTRSRRALAACAIVVAFCCLRLAARHEPGEVSDAGRGSSAKLRFPTRTAPKNIELAVEPGVGESSAPGWALESTRLIVVSPACGYFPRYLSLPERARIPPDDQDAASDILEELRQTLAQRFPRPDGADEERLHAGAVGEIVARWQQRDLAAQQKTLRAIDDPTMHDDLADDIRWLQRRNDDTYRLLEALLSRSMSPLEISELWRDDLAWCEATLTEAPPGGG
ncbi:MAG: hypothetical protein ABI678_03665 [Kofleriaceae bacterium]